MKGFHLFDIVYDFQCSFIMFALDRLWICFLKNESLVLSLQIAKIMIVECEINLVIKSRFFWQRLSYIFSNNEIIGNSLGT